MRLDDLFAGRFGPDEAGPAFEGPVAGTRRVVDVDPAAVGMRRVGAAIDASLRSDDGVGRRNIGVLSNHQVETYLAVLGTVAAGHTFVPLNPKFPTERLTDIVTLGSVDVILHDAGCREVLAALRAGGVGVPAVDVSTLVLEDADHQEVAATRVWREEIGSRPLERDAIAYVMFTSGSTGVPKGVPISNGNLVSYVRQVTDLLGIERGLRFTQFFDLSFDLSMHDIFVCTNLGGTLIAPSAVDLMMPSGYVSRERIDVWFSVPILGAQLVRSKPAATFGGILHMLFCGEALPMETVIACRPWLRAGGDMWNLYGPTEATIAFTGACVTASPRQDGTASIGGPFGDNEVALLVDGEVISDPAIGVEGELLLGGPQVFGGYSTDAPSPFVEAAGASWYRSGDLVHIDNDGVYFHGRLDSQVKYRGYRIELGDIEAAVRRTYDLKTVAVVLQGDRGDARLVAFHLAEESHDSLDAALLRTTLPAYMVPAEFVALDVMPTNQNNKIDRRALAQWTPNAPGDGGSG
ncbi:MAG: AMP-binding protein [Acidimicrobiia bacterium]